MKNYDNHLINRQSKHSRPISIGMLKAERLRIKNMRRAENGLAPKPTYAAI